jgi:nucleoid-associated protein YgaU
MLLQKGIKMKNSQVKKNNISKEKLAVIEALSRYKQDDETVNVYVRDHQETASETGKEKELDMLWDNFHINNNKKTQDQRSPGVYFVTGFIAGAVATLILAAALTFGLRAVDYAVRVLQAPKAPKAQKIKTGRRTVDVNFIPSSTPVAATVTPSETKSYTVVEGDTMEAIVIRNYGSFSLELQDKIVEVNKLANPNALSIGQKLLIPIEQ